MADVWRRETNVSRNGKVHRRQGHFMKSGKKVGGADVVSGSALRGNKPLLSSLGLSEEIGGVRSFVDCDGVVRDPLPVNTKLNDMDLRGLTFQVETFNSVDFSGSVLDGASFTHQERKDSDVYPVAFLACSFDGSSLRNVQFGKCHLCNGTSFRGADVEGVDFSKVTAGQPGDRISFSGSNITGEQFDALNSNTLWGSTVVYDEYSPEGVRAATGVDAKELKVMLWVGEIEFRDNITRQIVNDGRFNAEYHHIPSWELIRVQRSFEEVRSA